MISVWIPDNCARIGAVRMASVQEESVTVIQGFQAKTVLRLSVQPLNTSTPQIAHVALPVHQAHIKISTQEHAYLVMLRVTNAWANLTSAVLVTLPFKTP